MGSPCLEKEGALDVGDGVNDLRTFQHDPAGDGSIVHTEAVAIMDPCDEAEGARVSDGRLQTMPAPGTFARMRNGLIKDNEFEQFEEPKSLKNATTYWGMAVVGTADGDAEWNIIRMTFDADGMPTQRRFRSGVKWTERTIGW